MTKTPFLRYTQRVSASPIATNPSCNLQIPTKDKAQDKSEKFALVILRDLVRDLKTQSVETVCARADGTMQNCQIFEGISM